MSDLTIGQDFNDFFRDRIYEIIGRSYLIDYFKTVIPIAKTKGVAVFHSLKFKQIQDLKSLYVLSPVLCFVDD